MRGFFDISFQF